MYRSYQIFESFILLLYEHHREERSVQFCADKLFLSPKHLFRVVKEVSNKMVSAWIDDMVVLSAKALLKSTDIQIATIADELHFANASFFSNYFKKRVSNQSAERMQTIIEEILAYSTLDKKIEIVKTINLNKVIENIKTDLELIIKKRRHISHKWASKN